MNNKAKKYQREFKEVRKLVHSLIKTCPRVSEYPKDNTQGIYMLYVNDLTDESIIPVYVGKGTGKGGVQKRYVDHLNKLFELNRLSGSYLEHIVLDTRLLHGAYFYLKLLKYMADHRLSLDEIGCVLLEQCSKNNEFEREQYWIEKLKAPFFGFNQLNAIALSFVYIPSGWNCVDMWESDFVQCEKYWDYGFTRFNFRFGLNYGFHWEELLDSRSSALSAIASMRSRDKEEYSKAKTLRRIGQVEKDANQELEIVEHDWRRQVAHYSDKWLKENGIRGFSLQTKLSTVLKNASPDIHLRPFSKNIPEELEWALQKLMSKYSDKHVRSFCSAYNFIGELNDFWHPRIDSFKRNPGEVIADRWGYESYWSACLDVEKTWLCDILPADFSYDSCPLGNRMKPFQFELPKSENATLQLRLDLSANNPSMRKRTYLREQQQILCVEYRIVSSDKKCSVLQAGCAFIDCDINRHLLDKKIEYVLKLEFDDESSFNTGGFKTWMAAKGHSPLSEKSDELLWRHSPELRQGNWNEDGPEYPIAFERSCGINKSALEKAKLVSLRKFLLPVLNAAKEKELAIEIISNASSNAVKDALISQLCNGDSSEYKRIMKGPSRTMPEITPSVPRQYRS